MKVIYAILAIILIVIASPLTLLYAIHKTANRLSENIYNDSPLEKGKS